MNKKILVALLSLFMSVNAFADTCAVGLIPTFPPSQARKLCSTFVGTSTVGASLIPGSDNAYDLGSTSFYFRSLYLKTNIILPTYGTSRVIVGATSANADITGAAGAPPLLTLGGTGGNHSATFIGNGADTNGAFVSMMKTRSTAGDANTIVASGDQIASITGYGADGADYVTAAKIQMKVDGTPGTADMPGSILFQTSPDGSATLATVLTLKNDKSAVFTGTVTSSATGALGWSYVTGANTACTSTCTFAAVFGVDLAGGASAPVIVDAASATADACVCAGAS